MFRDSIISEYRQDKRNINNCILMNPPKKALYALSNNLTTLAAHEASKLSFCSIKNAALDYRSNSNELSITSNPNLSFVSDYLTREEKISFFKI